MAQVQVVANLGMIYLNSLKISWAHISGSGGFIDGSPVSQLTVGASGRFSTHFGASNGQGGCLGEFHEDSLTAMHSLWWLPLHCAPKTIRPPEDQVSFQFYFDWVLLLQTYDGNLGDNFGRVRS